ncbi:hypothetical protein QTO34_000340 [Cnephaeus nilssonii]|uniref:Uncharacterized protein n=1 Tax=Cnephaeus nilssonii TaxID=3371016 RepID=A0AA40LWT6_CNENI|nr:hypothetical protein QTO34_000340 [Eptesicus nilssonii]
MFHWGLWGEVSPLEVKKRCEIDWPFFGVGWPAEGTLDIPTIKNVYRVITGDPGHPDQFSNIDQWLEIAQLKPPWIWLCVHKKGQNASPGDLGSQVLGEGWTLQEGGSVFYYQPFTTTDLLNWKHHTPAYSEKPQAMVDLLESIFQIHKPTWVDCKQLLLMLFNTEEHMRIVMEAHKWLQTQVLAGILDTDRWAREALPDEEP